MEIIIFSRSQSIIINSGTFLLGKKWFRFVMYTFCHFKKNVSTDTTSYETICVCLLYSVTSLVWLLFHKRTAMIVIILIRTIIIFVLLHYFENVFTFRVFLSLDNSSLIWENDDNNFYIIDTDGQGGLERFPRPYMQFVGRRAANQTHIS